MDSKRVKAVIDLHDYLTGLGKDRPKVSSFLKELSINPETAWDAVILTAKAIQQTYPEYATQIANDLFKLGIIIGYKYGIKTFMDKEFGLSDQDHKEDPDPKKRSN